MHPRQVHPSSSFASTFSKSALPFVIAVFASNASGSAQADSNAGNAAPAATTEVAVEKGGPYDRVFHPENLPAAEDAQFFAHRWEHLAAGPEHNAAFALPAAAPSWLRQGIEWNFAEARSWPLEHKDAFDNAVYGDRRGPSTQTQFYGNAVGVSAANGIVYAESDDQFAYAINARTGKLIWRTSPVGNTLMGTPIVADGKVYLSAGNVGFNFSNVSAFAKTKTAKRGEGMVIPPFLKRFKSRGQAAKANFCFGVMPPSAMFGRS